MSYCTYITTLGEEKEADRLHKNYHDERYGFPIADDNELFGRLLMEINQAGLSWTTILKKEAAFRKAYHNFNIHKIAAYKEKDMTRLLNDAGIIRNRLKITAAIENAKTVKTLIKQHGSFHEWIMSYHPLTLDDWTKLFRKTFRFTGGEIVNEFLMSTGYLKGAHDENCPVHRKVLRSKPAWIHAR